MISPASFGRRLARAFGARPAGSLPPRETVQEYFARRGASGGCCETVHPASVAANPLPANVSSRNDLPDDRGWWGFSFRDVPCRPSAETFIATLPDCRVVWYRDPAKANDFYPAVLAGDSTALDIRELRFRPPHEDVLRRLRDRRQLHRATWIVERVYHNHSHWLTAHLPKLLLLRERDALDDVLLPAERTPAIDSSLRLAGFDPGRFRTFEGDTPLEVDELTLLGTDRFRPELVRLVPQALGIDRAARGRRKVFISRAKAGRRRLLNEDEIWRLLEPEGFERVCMEDLAFDAQVALMGESAVLLAPHGAGLTNMMFCPPGADIVEIADPGFPNPNFYALACALRHRYWIVPARSSGTGHPLEKDLLADADAVGTILRRLGEAP